MRDIATFWLLVPAFAFDVISCRLKMRKQSNIKVEQTRYCLLVAENIPVIYNKYERATFTSVLFKCV